LEQVISIHLVGYHLDRPGKFVCHKELLGKLVDIQLCSRGGVSETHECGHESLLILRVIIVHKSQSITIDQAVINLLEWDFQLGLSYIALSRVKTLEGLMLDVPFDRGNLYTEKATLGMQMKL
jgi:hypothetical protein